MGIRAVVENGVIRPIDPLPLDWPDGHPVVVDDADSPPLPSDALTSWFEELDHLGPARYEPGEREQLQIDLAEADRQAKDLVRRAMDLP